MRILQALGAALLLLAISTGTVLAGEVTGTGEETPIKEGVANSICAFSGLNDREEGEGPTEPRVQSWGEIVSTFGPLGGAPGTACNPTRAPQP